MKIKLCTILITLSFTSFAFSSTPIKSLSLSSNGKQVISINQSKQASLWNLSNKSHKTISRNANIYSAYFIKNSPFYAYQNDGDLDLLIQQPNKKDSKIVRLSAPIYSLAISTNLNNIFYSDEAWNIFKTSATSTTKLKDGFNRDNMWANGTTLRLTLSPNGKELLSYGFSRPEFDKLQLNQGTNTFAAKLTTNKKLTKSLLDGVTLWNAQSNKPIAKLSGNINKTISRFSPDQKYVVSGDELGYLQVCKLKNQQCTLSHKTSMLSPKNFPKECRGDFSAAAISSINFLSNNYFIKTVDGHNIAFLYKLPSNAPIKCFLLKPSSNTQLESSNVIDSSAQTHILVLGKKHTDGIIAYKFDPKKLTLKETWSAGSFHGS